MFFGRIAKKKMENEETCEKGQGSQAHCTCFSLETLENQLLAENRLDKIPKPQIRCIKKPLKSEQLQIVGLF